MLARPVATQRLRCSSAVGLSLAYRPNFAHEAEKDNAHDPGWTAWHLSEQAAEIAVPPGREHPAFMLPFRSGPYRLAGKLLITRRVCAGQSVFPWKSPAGGGGDVRSKGRRGEGVGKLHVCFFVVALPVWPAIHGPCVVCPGITPKAGVLVRG